MIARAPRHLRPATTKHRECIRDATSSARPHVVQQRPEVALRVDGESGRGDRRHELTDGVVLHGVPGVWWAVQTAIVGYGVVAVLLLRWSYRMEPNPFAIVLWM